MTLRSLPSIVAACLVASLAACSKSPPPAPSPDPAAGQPAQAAAAASSAEGGRGRRHRGGDDGDGHGDGRGDGDGHGRRGGRFALWDADKFLARADTNKNGKVELTELPEKSRAKMAELDTNKDGALSKDELEAHSKKLLEKRFNRLDKNKDGSIGKDEMPERMWDHFKVADADNNGAITLVEMQDALKSGKLRSPGRPDRGGGADDKEPDIDDMVKGATEE